MIFNPLFFNNNTDNHIISNRTEKLSKKKYLFSDIVKVVMNPILDPKDKSAQVVYNESKDLEIPMAYGQIPVKMHLKFVSNLNNELNEKELTEILPSEISKFITTTNDAEEEIISYLSKDQLNGELKSFVNNVIDPEFINNIISQGQGLLLSIEDSKSAVNIELSKASNNIENNITVQTVIIPQKEKLLSIVAEDKNSQSLFRYKNGRTVPISDVTKSENKPSLSLYVFKNDNQIVNNFTTTIFNRNKTSDSKTNFPNQDLMTKSAQIQNGELSNKQSNTINQNSENLSSSILNNNTTDRKTNDYDIKNSEKKSDFDVNKITIVKKTSESDLVKILQHPTKQSIFSAKKLELINLSNSKGNKIFSINNKSTDKKPTLKIINGNESKIKQNDDLAESLNSKSNKVSEEVKSNKSNKIKYINSTPTNNKQETNSPEILNQIKSDNKIGDQLIGLSPNKNTLTNKNGSSVTNEVQKKVNNNQNASKQASHVDEKSDKSKEFSIKLKGNLKSIVNKNDSSIIDSQQIKESANKSNEEALSVNTTETNAESKSNSKSTSERNENSAIQSEKNTNSANSNQENLSAKDNNQNSDSQFKQDSMNLMPNEDKEKLFSQIFNKNENIASSDSKDLPISVNQEKSNKVIKSAEIIRELSKYILKQEKGSLTFNIKPEHLGQIKIMLDTIDNVIKARIEVDNEQAKQLLEKNLEKLYQELSENGLKLNSLNISLGNQRKQKGEKVTKSKNQSENKSLGQVGESEEEKQKKSLGYNTYEYIA